MLDEPFELVQRGQGSPYKLKRTPKLVEKMSRPAEMNAEWLRHPTDHTNVMLTALGRVLALPQALGDYTRGCADAPPQRKLHKIRGTKPLISEQEEKLHQGNESFIASLRLQRVIGSKPLKDTNALPPK